MLAAAVILAVCVASVFWVTSSQRKDHRNPIAFLYDRAIRAAQVEDLDVAMQTTLYFAYPSEEVKIMIADTLDSSWSITDPKNGNVIFSRGPYRTISVFANPGVMGGSPPAGAKSVVIYYDPKEPF